MYRSLFLASALASCTSLYAIAYRGHPHQEIAWADDENAPTTNTPVPEEKKPKGPMYALCGNGFFASGDLLYWKAHEDGLEYALKYRTPSSALVSAPVDGRLEGLHFDWDFGFRVGLGYRARHDAWELSLNWTAFETQASGSAEVKDAQTLGPEVPGLTNLSPLWFPVIYNNALLPGVIGIGDTPQKMSAHWHLDYHTLDFQLGRECFATHAFSLRPYLGVRAAWILQTYGNKARGGTYPIAPPTTLRIHNDYRGVGLLSGFGLSYHLNKYLSFYGNLSGALLWGVFEIRNKIKGAHPPLSLPAPTTPPHGTLFAEHHHFRRLRACIDVGIGIQWQALFCKEKLHVALSVGYEMLEWFRQNQMRQYLNWSNIYNTQEQNNLSVGFNVPQRGNLGLQGLSASARFGY